MDDFSRTSFDGSNALVLGELTDHIADLCYSPIKYLLSLNTVNRFPPSEIQACYCLRSLWNLLLLIYLRRKKFPFITAKSKHFKIAYWTYVVLGLYFGFCAGLGLKLVINCSRGKLEISASCLIRCMLSDTTRTQAELCT